MIPNELPSVPTRQAHSVPAGSNYVGRTYRRHRICRSLFLSLALVGNLAQAQLTVQEGLVLWLQADAGVTADGSGGVSMWEDQSPHGNHAYGVVAEEFPRRIDGVVNGQPVIRFDGVDALTL